MTIRSNWQILCGLVVALFGGMFFWPLVSPSSGGPAAWAEVLEKPLQTLFVSMFIVWGTLRMRPAILMSRTGMVVRGILLDHIIPWGAVREAYAKSCITVVYTGPDGAPVEAEAMVFGSGKGNYGSPIKRERVVSEITARATHHALVARTMAVEPGDGTGRKRWVRTTSIVSAASFGGYFVTSALFMIFT
ncbi:hypothetical protein [Actinomadura parmotrematis]|uniref:PH domain-containing protein n=1 Tax=Actinomadura parmotrematis TaxID=2864039 RepID=A0ABS7G672_9ACTN|nr:hypothetical protein [Actinomadura parmotrematis]MBW8487374.1 hypothetical protein [Actinomadura parmotrematis]